MVDLHVRRLVGDPGVTRGVALVEAVAAEAGNQVPDLVDQVLGQLLLLAPFLEDLFLGGDDLAAFLADGLDQLVGSRQRNVAQAVEDLHDLFLVGHDAVGLVEHLVQHRVGELVAREAVFVAVVVADHLHRPGPIEGIGGNQVLEAVGLHLLKHVPHAGTIELEHAARLAASEQFQNFRLVGRQAFQVDRRPAPCRHKLDRSLQYRQGLQTQEVHLQQADLLDDVHGPLRRDLVAHLAQRTITHQRRVGNHYAGGVHRSMTAHAFQPPGNVDQFAHPVVLVDHLAQLGFDLQGPVEGHLQLGRDLLGDHVNLGQRNVQRAAHVADHRPGGHRPEGDDLGHVLAAVLVTDVLDHLGTGVLANVDVDVRHLVAAGVHEPLKKQTVAQRIDVTEAKHIAHQRPDGAAASAAGNVMLAGVVDEVPHDKEVTREVFPLNDRQLAIHPLAKFFGHLAVSPLQTLVAELPEVIDVAHTVRGLEDGGMPLAKIQLQVAQPGDAGRSLQGFRIAGESPLHLLARLDVELAFGVAHAVGIADNFAGRDAQQHIVSLGVVGPQVMDVVGRYDAHADFVGQLGQQGHDPQLVFDAVVLNLDEEVVRPDQVAIELGHLSRFVAAVAEHQSRHLAGQAGGHDDQPLGMFGQDGLVDSRLVVETVEVGGRGQVQQVAEPVGVAGQQDQMVSLILDARDGFLDRAVARRDVGLVADDWLDAFGLAGTVEIDRAEQVTVVGQRDGRLAEFCGNLG